MINLLVALPAEARPLVRRFGLRRDPDSKGFTLFRGESVNLVVSGTGKSQAAGAVGWLQGTAGAGVFGWLNVGIAGHAHRAIGEVFLANRITDEMTGRSWYPPVVYDPGCDTDRVITVDIPESDFPSDAAYDMEAAGLYPIACRFVTAELVHCVKVISDNRTNPAESLDSARVSALIEDRGDVIEGIVANLQELVASVSALQKPPRGLDELLAGRRFSVTQRHVLRRSLESLAIQEISWESLGLDRSHTARQVLAKLHAALERSCAGGSLDSTTVRA